MRTTKIRKRKCATCHYCGRRFKPGMICNKTTDREGVFVGGLQVGIKFITIYHCDECMNDQMNLPRMLGYMVENLPVGLKHLANNWTN